MVFLVAAIAATFAFAGGDDDEPTASDGGANDDASAAPAPPVGTRYVGVGHAVIAVPEEWSTNAHQCGTPTEPTALVDIGAICMMYVPYPADTDSVEVRPSYEGEEFTDWVPIQIGGLDALRSPDEEFEETLGADGAKGRAIYGASVYVPSENAVFRARSSNAQERVDALLDTVAVVEGYVAVPGFRVAEKPYLETLAELGLRADEVPGDRVDGLGSGTVTDVDPEPGTLVPPGATVRVGVAP